MPQAHALDKSIEKRNKAPEKGRTLYKKGEKSRGKLEKK